MTPISPHKKRSTGDRSQRLDPTHVGSDIVEEAERPCKVNDDATTGL
jgi:hypothetical protein